MTSSDGAERMARQGRVVRELSAVHRLTETRLNRSLRPLGLSMTQVTLLTQLINRPAGIQIGELADAMEINQPGVSKIVNALAAREAVSVRVLPGDARRRVVSLTETGWGLIASARQAMHPQASTILADLDDADLDTLARLLEIVRDRLVGSAD